MYANKRYMDLYKYQDLIDAFEKERYNELKKIFDSLESLDEFKSDDENDIEEEYSVYIYDTIKYPPNVKPHDVIFWFLSIYKSGKLKFTINTSLKWMNN